MNLLDRLRPNPYRLSNGSDNRSADAYVKVLMQFRFDTSPRYQPGEGATYCNIAMWDASRALACEIPHWWIRADGQYGEQEETINATIDWLATQGADYGWGQLPDNLSAQGHASLGIPTIVTWKNPNGHGHVAWVMPSGNLAQAGATCGYEIPLSSVFPAALLPQLQYWSNG